MSAEKGKRGGTSAWRLAPCRYRIGACESYYTYMAAQGFRLSKAGSVLDRFERAQPQKLLYRVELSQERDFPQVQRELYEDCGWSYLTHQGVFHIFTADPQKNPPEIHTDPRIQAGSVRRLRRECLSRLLCGLFWLFYPLLYFLLPQGHGFLEVVVAETGLFLLVEAVNLTFLYPAVRGAFQAGRLLRRLKKGIPLDHSVDWTKGRGLNRGVCGLLAAMLLVCGGQALWERLSARELPLPEEGEGLPILLISEIGPYRRATADEAIDFVGYSVKLEEGRSLLAPEHLHTYELGVAEDGSKAQAWMYQDAYLVRTPQLALSLARSIARNSIWMDGLESYEIADSGALDLLLLSHMELIAVRGSRVLYITYLGEGTPKELVPFVEEKLSQAC